MPVILIKDVAIDQKLGLWQIAETEDKLFERIILSEKEVAQYGSFTNEKRKVQWLATRLLLRELTGQHQEIKYNENGTPFTELINISISHSGNHVAIITSKKKETGIDIELLDPKIQNLYSRFLSLKEIEEVEGQSMEKAYVYWCAKESLYKLYGKKELIFKENLFVDPFDYKGAGRISGKIKKGKIEINRELVYEKSGDYMLVYVLND